MRADAFLQLVEIRTKAASVLPYLTGTLYAAAVLDRFDLSRALLMLTALLCIDLATTTLNHVADAHSAYSTLRINGVKYAKGTVYALIGGLLIVGVAVGGWLASQTGPVVWFLGALSFLTGILYSSGPLPLQRTPLGEILSGFFMGFVIVFLAVYIHVGNDLVHAYVFGERFTLDADFRGVFRIVLLSLPLVTAIANLMLANNICDQEQDLKNHRYTLPVLTGSKDALIWFQAGYILGGIALILAVILRVLPLRGLLLVPVYGQVLRNARRFAKAPDKLRTFPLAVWNLDLIGLGLVAVLLSLLLIQP